MLNLVGNRRFKPSMVGIVLTLIGVIGCFRLGVWQLDRAADKRALMLSFATGSERAAEVSGELRGLPRYQSIELTGRYDSRQQILLDNMPWRGRPGYHVLTPLQREGGEWVLVDRGWVPLGKTRTQLPEVRVDERVRIVRGQIDELPRPGIRLGSSAPETSAGEAGAGWPKVLNFPTQQDLTAVLNRPLAPGRVLLNASQPDGYERAWQAQFGFPPERHLAYAVQWFGLLAAILVTFMVVSTKKVAQDDVG